MWKPTCVLPDGNAVDLPDDVRDDTQAAVYYGGLCSALVADMNEGNIDTEDGISRAVALGQEIAGHYNLDGLSDAIGFAGVLAGMDGDERPSDDFLDGDGDPLYGPDDDIIDQHQGSHRAKKAA